MAKQATKYFRTKSPRTRTCGELRLLQRQEVEVQIPKDLTWILSSLNAAGQPGAQVGGVVVALKEQPGQGAIQGCRRIFQSLSLIHI